jgi:hypothetical protein
MAADGAAALCTAPARTALAAGPAGEQWSGPTDDDGPLLPEHGQDGRRGRGPSAGGTH